MATPSAPDTVRSDRAARVTWLSIILNTLLMCAKLFVGILAHSGAVIADALHSASDFITDFTVMIGMRLARKPQDEDHPYGHGKYETLAAVIVGVFLCGVGLLIACHAGESLVHALVFNEWPERPALPALWISLVSIVLKEALFHLTVRVARETKSAALMANAWHHRSDAWTSVAAAVGAGLAALFGGKWILLDPLAAAVVGGILLKIAWSIVCEALDHLLEHGMSAEENRSILDLLHTVPDLSEPHHIRARRVGTVAVIELHFRVSPAMTVHESHLIATHVEDKLCELFGSDAIITLHVEPVKPPLPASHERNTP